MKNVINNLIWIILSISMIILFFALEIKIDHEQIRFINNFFIENQHKWNLFEAFDLMQIVMWFIVLIYNSFKFFLNLNKILTDEKK